MGEELCFLEMRAGRANASPPLEKLCNWPALIEELVMGVHSTGVQWPAPPQGPHLLICGSPLPGKYAHPCARVSATARRILPSI